MPVPANKRPRIGQGMMGVKMCALWKERTGISLWPSLTHVNEENMNNCLTAIYQYPPHLKHTTTKAESVLSHDTFKSVYKHYKMHRVRTEERVFYGIVCLFVCYGSV